MLAALIGVAATAPAAAFTELAADYGGCLGTLPSDIVDVGPNDNYQAAVDAATAGTHVRLAAGTYTNGLRLYDLRGEPANCIVVEGPATGTAVFVGAPLNGIRNVVQIRNSRFLVLRNIEIDGSGTTDIDAIKSEALIAGTHAAAWSHHITLESLYIHDFDGDQQQVGISTKGPAWNWVVRNNRLERIGTGMYFGNSDGAQHFINGLIEFNLIRDTIGYNAQFKHQNASSRPNGPGFETLPVNGRTVIRHNVLHKSNNSSLGGLARPNLLVGASPLTGSGADDEYLIAGNFLYQNPTGSEPLLQGEGNLSAFGNLFYNSEGPAIVIRPHNGEVRRVRLFYNTVFSGSVGILVSNLANPGFSQLVRGNAVFAASSPIVGGDQLGNLSDALSNAESYLANPYGAIGIIAGLDLHPLPNALDGAAVDDSVIADLVDADRDFADSPRDSRLRGAYSRTAGGWPLSLTIKSLGSAERVFDNGFE